MMPTRLALAAGTVGLTVLLAACTGGSNGNDRPLPIPTVALPSATASPTPSPSPTPTLSKEDAAQQANVDDAQGRFAEYLEVSDRVLAEPGSGDPLRTVRPYIGSEEMVTWWQSVPQQFTDQGLHQTGTSTLVSVDVTDYEGDPLSEGTQIVTMEACVDFTDVEVVDADGNPAESSYTATTPVVQDVVMQRQPDDRWTVQEASTRQPFTEC
ncbi:hypothetical protein MWU57_08100 [Isoptericola sp. S6320L]|uniref:hypothetical protein n=1 Tax=Isoptericola sp. S6320L TaxID=2926411 RepID=UPI001FF39F3B|nr:hypothetical protein [Isoptericola sp. S6320L]MCK0116996.1 hypothetical protein [Isoptericola sp. S6320L]